MSSQPEGVIIRPATNADCEQIRNLVFGVFAEFGFEREAADRDLDDIEGRYLSRGGLFEVLERDGKVIGTVGLLPTGDRVCELRKMYLAREERGKGLGRLLLERMIAAARARRFRRMELETASRLVGALRLYERFGFKAIPKSGETDRCDLVMALDL